MKRRNFKASVEVSPTSAPEDYEFITGQLQTSNVNNYGVKRTSEISLPRHKLSAIKRQPVRNAQQNILEALIDCWPLRKLAEPS